MKSGVQFLTRGQSHSGLKLSAILIVLGLLLTSQVLSSSAAVIPTTSIVSVTPDTSVTIRTYNFPANQEFRVTMGPFGTQGVNGTYVATTNSGSGGSFDVTYNIPTSLKGSAQISIRLESTSGYYYAYDWFNNVAGGTSSSSTYVPSNSGTTSSTTSGYTGTPSTLILSVVKDTSVTLRAINFPANQQFRVTMGPAGTKGVNGTFVATTSIATSGTFEETYYIPSNLSGSSKISIRLESPQGYYAYDWFYNSTGSGTTTTNESGTSATAAPTITPTGSPTVTSGYSGYPTTEILSVVKDTSVTLRAKNMPSNQDFSVTMGAYGTKGVNGTYVATTSSGSGGTFDVTYSIPSNLTGSSKIAIRLESTQGFYAYDWFTNN
jgi:hypothetical protein